MNRCALLEELATILHASDRIAPNRREPYSRPSLEANMARLIDLVGAIRWRCQMYVYFILIYVRDSCFGSCMTRVQGDRCARYTPCSTRI